MKYATLFLDRIQHAGLTLTFKQLRGFEIHAEGDHFVIHDEGLNLHVFGRDTDEVTHELRAAIAAQWRTYCFTAASRLDSEGQALRCIYQATMWEGCCDEMAA